MSFVWIYGEKIYNKQAQSSQSKHQTSTEPEWTLPHIKSDALNKPNEVKVSKKYPQNPHLKKHQRRGWNIEQEHKNHNSQHININCPSIPLLPFFHIFPQTTGTSLAARLDVQRGTMDSFPRSGCTFGAFGELYVQWPAKCDFCVEETLIFWWDFIYQHPFSVPTIKVAC